jgi:CxxC-x17-CxxC domain-containing protein
VRATEVISVSYTDRTLTCVDCSVEFIHSAADQEFYTEKGFVSDPKRCPSCRASRRAMRDSSGYETRDIGGPRGYERGDNHTQREYFAVICSKCGNAAQVPFKPRMDKPVYCSDCFRTVQAEGDAAAAAPATDGSATAAGGAAAAESAGGAESA